MRREWIASALCSLAYLTLMSGGCAHDLRGPIGLQAKTLVKKQPETTWETVLPVEERYWVGTESADFIEFVSPDEVLIGLVHVLPPWNLPHYRQFVLVDVNSKTIRGVHDSLTRWRSQSSFFVRDFPNRLDHPVPAVLLMTQPVLLIKEIGSNGATVLTALDSKTAGFRWEYVAEQSPAVSVGGRHVIIVRTKDSAPIVEALDVATGSSVWTQPLTGEANGVWVLGHQVYVTTRSHGLTSFRLSDGVPQWTKDHKLLRSEDARIVPRPEGLLIWAAQGMALLSYADGKDIWNQVVGQGVISRLASLDGTFVRLVEAPGGSAPVVTMQAIDPMSGQVRWTAERPGLIVSNVAKEHMLLLFTTTSDLVGLDAQTGAPVFRTALSPSFRGGTPESVDLPQSDLIRTTSGAAYISRERAGVAAYRLTSGALLWSSDNYQFDSYALGTLAMSPNQSSKSSAQNAAFASLANQTALNHATQTAQVHYESSSRPGERTSTKMEPLLVGPSLNDALMINLMTQVNAQNFGAAPAAAMTIVAAGVQTGKISRQQMMV